MKKILPLVLALITLASCQSRDGDFTIFSPEEDLTLGSQMAAAIDADPENYPILEPAKHPNSINIWKASGIKYLLQMTFFTAMILAGNFG
jgi:isopenicillin N synthase-like dioxygenase